MDESHHRDGASTFGQPRRGRRRCLRIPHNQQKAQGSSEVQLEDDLLWRFYRSLRGGDTGIVRYAGSRRRRPHH